MKENLDVPSSALYQARTKDHPSFTMNRSFCQLDQYQYQWRCEWAARMSSAKRSTPKAMILLAVLLILAITSNATLAADEFIDGNLTVDQQLIVGGDLVDIGGNSSTAPSETPGEPGVLLIYSDPSTPDGEAKFEHRSTRSASSWHWQNVDGPTVKDKAVLARDNRLLLFPLNGTIASVVIDPGSVGQAASITLDGNRVVLEGDTQYFLPASTPISSSSSAGSVVLGNYSGGTESWNPPTAATGSYALAWGARNSAKNYASTAWGIWNEATGDNSTVWGEVSKATAWASTAAGFGAEANSFSSFVIGRYNAVQPASGGTWVGTDPLFVVGNGSDWNVRSNALTLFKNGNLRVSGAIEAKGGLRTSRQGDISMGPFTAGQDPATLDASTGLNYPPPATGAPSTP